jgi:ABC-2 type transporter
LFQATPIAYFLIGFSTQPERFFLFWFTIVMLGLVGSSLGIAVGYLLPNQAVVSIVVGVSQVERFYPDGELLSDFETLWFTTLCTEPVLAVQRCCLPVFSHPHRLAVVLLHYTVQSRSARLGRQPNGKFEADYQRGT